MKGLLLLAAVAAMHLSVCQAHAGSLIDVEALNLKLKASNAGWVAKDTFSGGLTKQDAIRMMGLERTSRPDTQFIDVRGYTRGDLPTVVDWRDKDGANWVSPILNQANCGSCVAFAAIGVLETMVNISSGMPNTHVKLSPQNLFSCGGGSCSFGWAPVSAAQFLQSTGVTDEACMPYTSGAIGGDVACSASCADSAQRAVRIASFNSPTRTLRNVDSVKAALTHGPVVTTLSVYADFMTYASGVYKHVSGDVLGGHAISIVGYDDTKQAYIVRNSWGSTWGMGGFAYVAYDDVSGVGDETWSFQMPAMSGTVSLSSPDDYAYVTDSMTVDTGTTYHGATSLKITINDDRGRGAMTSECAGNCRKEVDVRTLADGRYTIRIEAVDAHGASLGISVPHLFYVANTKPTMTLSFKGKGVDLATTLTGRIEFDIATATSTAVPMSALDFHFRGPDGVDQIRVAQVVLSEMSMGWRTNLVPSGSYEIWMVGHMKTNAFDSTIETAHQTVNVSN